MSIDPITTPIYPNPLDSALTTLAVAHTVGQTTLTVVSASSFGSPTTSAPIRITCQRVSDNVRVHFKVTGITGAVMTIAGVMDGYTDIALSVGDNVGVLVSAGTILDLQTTDLTLVSTVNDLITSDSGKAPLASPTFTGSPAAPTPTSSDNSTIIATTAFVKAQGYLTSAGTVTSVSASVPSGLTVNVTNPTSTPAIAVTTSLSGVLKGTGSGFTTATAGTDYVIPSGNITGTAAGLSTTLAVASGGTGQTTASAAINALLPDQTSSSSKVLATNGSASSWVTAVRPTVATAFTAQQNFAQATLTDGSSISWDLSAAQAAIVTLGGNRTLANPSNLVAGGTYVLIVVQDGTGTRTLAYGTAYKWPGGTAPTLSTAAGSIDVLTFISDGTKMLGFVGKDFS